MKPDWVYLMANHRRGRTYLGVTINLVQRAYQHRNRLIDGHSRERGCLLLVWYQHFDDLQEARACELRMKKVASRLETKFDRGAQSGLARPI